MLKLYCSVVWLLLYNKLFESLMLRQATKQTKLEIDYVKAGDKAYDSPGSD